MSAEPETVTIPRAEYVALRERIEDLEDSLALQAAERNAAAGGREYLPVEIVERMIAGEPPLRIWRKHRQLTLNELARRAGITPGYISEIETGKELGSIDAWKALAATLGVTIDDIVT